MQSFIPYCGAPPIPGSLTWNTDPWLTGALLACAALYLGGAARLESGPTRRERHLFLLGWAMVAVALVSHLCNLSIALFSARVGQHLLLTLVAAPLVALGRPELVLARLLRGRASAAAARPPGSARVVIGWAAFTVALWVWHLPGPYDATLQSNIVYWAMHLSLFGAAVLLWHALLVAGGARPELAVAAGFATAIQMSLLSAILTLAPRALFASHSATTWPWGLSPLQDQQLGGLLMWVVGGTLFTLIALAGLGLWLSRLGHRESLGIQR
jgi:putative membrane protein